MRFACALLLCVACTRAREVPGGPVTIVLEHQPLWGDPAPFHAFLDRFRAQNPDVVLRTQTLPNASDMAREMLVTALEGGAQDFDVFPIDVIWAPEFARAGWLADLSAAFPPESMREEFLRGAVEAVTLDGRIYAVPWFLDVGLLYYRKDLVPRAPRTYGELRAYAREAMQRGVQGYLWQGRQSEGLNCNVFESVWGHGGELLKDGRIAVDTPQARAGTEWLRETLATGLSPRSVVASGEEETRRAFQDGRAAFMRNWPYAWALLQEEGSAVRGKVGFAALPSESGAPGPGALGGWQLAVNAHVSPRRREAAIRLLRFLTSEPAAVELALRYSRIPARRAAYDDPRLVAEAPFIHALLPMALAARPRPATPYYALASDSIQGELSAAITGLRPTADALLRAQRVIDHLEGPSR